MWVLVSSLCTDLDKSWKHRMAVQAKNHLTQLYQRQTPFHCRLVNEYAITIALRLPDLYSHQLRNLYLHCIYVLSPSLRAGLALRWASNTSQMQMPGICPCLHPACYHLVAM